MKPIYIIQFLFYILFFSTEILCATGDYNNANLTGVITDKQTHATLPGATIYIPDLKLGIVANNQGFYSFSQLPSARLIFQISFLGYKTITELVDLSKTSVLNVELEPSSIDVSEVVVTGSGVSSDIRHSSVSVTTIRNKELLSIPSSNLINSLTSIPGISAITTGGAVAKPVIRGLSYNHVITLNDGMRQEGNQWGDEHGIEIDQFAVDKIEILKGPASLLYGSDALGGVINIMEPTPAHVGHIDSEIDSRYSTNNDLIATSIMNQGNINGFLWKIRGTYKNAASFQTPTEYVYNSGFSEKDFSGTFGVNKSWGYSHLHLSSYAAKIGSIEAERDSATGMFVNTHGEIVSPRVLKGRSLDLPFQNVDHQKIGLVNNFMINGNHQLKVNIGYQTNNRKEFSESNDNPGLFFHLNSFTYDVKYILGEKNGWEPVIGFSGMHQENVNKGNEYLIPDFKLTDIGSFIYLKKSYQRFTFNGGIRYDIRNIGIAPLTQMADNTEKVIFEKFNTKLKAISGALGLTYEINPNLDFKFNMGRGFRAPNIAELSSNGVHEGTFRYEKGNKELVSETSLQTDGELSYHTNRTAITLSLFYNPIRNYIYQRNIGGETITSDGTVYPVYRFVQGNSLLTGFELFADIHPAAFLHFENSVSYVYAQNQETKAPLPFIPPLHSKHLIRWVITPSLGRIKNPFISLQAELYSQQSRIDAFETKTNGYALMGISLGTDLQIGNVKASLFLSGNNLTNKAYYDHLNRLKYVGIYNPGRDFSFGIVLPLETELK